MTVPCPKANTKYEFKGLVDYGQANLVSGADGNLALWLPNGEYTFKITGFAWKATVNDADTTAVREKKPVPFSMTIR